MAFLELCKSGKFSQCSSINFGQYYNFPKNATQISLSMRQSFQADELFIERFVVYFIGADGVAVGWTGRVTRTSHYLFLWEQLVFVFTYIFKFVLFHISYFGHRKRMNSFMQGWWYLIAAGQYWIVIFVELNLNQQMGKHIFVNRRRKKPLELNSIICFLFASWSSFFFVVSPYSSFAFSRFSLIQFSLSLLVN